MKTRVLIFPAGEFNSIELHDALSHNVNIELFGCSSVDRHGGYVFKKYRCGLPNISANNFIDEFNKLLVEWNIDIVFPTHDTVALFFASHKDEIKTKIMVPDLRTAEICRDKKYTYSVFSDCDFCPHIYFDFSQFPVFIKPRDGQGGKGAKLINSLDEVPKDISFEDYAITEYLPGKELTVDCLTDAYGKLRACLPRIRNRMMAGVCVSGESVQASEEILEIAGIINDRLTFCGLWYFQVKQSEDESYKLLEVSARTAGTMCLSRARGVNLPLLSIYVAQGKDISVFENNVNIKLDRTLISRYKMDYHYDKVFIDYDDTIIEGDEVCTQVINFIYQCRNKGIKVILLTRHEENHDDALTDSLTSHAISLNLFAEIIKLKERDEKADYIDGKDAIFIDNSYAERKKVHDKLKIPVFDVEGIEVLLDWRC